MTLQVRPDTNRLLLVPGSSNLQNECCCPECEDPPCHRFDACCDPYYGELMEYPHFIVLSSTSYAALGSPPPTYVKYKDCCYWYAGETNFRENVNPGLVVASTQTSCEDCKGYDAPDCPVCKSECHGLDPLGPLLYPCYPPRGPVAYTRISVSISGVGAASAFSGTYVLTYNGYCKWCYTLDPSDPYSPFICVQPSGPAAMKPGQSYWCVHLVISYNCSFYLVTTTPVTSYDPCVLFGSYLFECHFEQNPVYGYWYLVTTHGYCGCNTTMCTDASGTTAVISANV